MTSLYRKWRSQSFDDLVGQDHVTRTLRNAVRDQRVAHAYLFTGPRGTGKTSTARILARAVNCLSPRDGNPDNSCEMCVAAQEGRALDVIEIDAASNTSVDNVRDLRERVGYAAGEGQHKVYIVDEVHRLSPQAFDAFLKTLEEPPPHVIFVFASTEPHKVPATIASRCQRFDFKRISPLDTLERVRMVSTAEGMQVSDDALLLIARSAAGSLRDALGLLDQVSAYATDGIDAAAVRATLGLADPGLIARLTDALIANRVGDGLMESATFVDAGGDPRELTVQLVGYWRALLLLSVGTTGIDLDLDPDLVPVAAQHAARLDRARILGVLAALTENDFSPKYNLTSSLPFEVGYVSAALALCAQPIALEHPASRSPGVAVSTELRPRLVPAPVDPPAPRTASTGLSTPPPRAEVDSSVAADAMSSPPNGGSPPPVRVNGMHDPDVAWQQIVNAMRSRSQSLQALLRSAYLMGSREGELQVGFLYEWHKNQVSDPKKRRVLEEVVQEVLGTPYRVDCVLTTKEEVAKLRGEGALDDDGFIDEAAERLRQFHIRHLNDGST